MNKVKSTFTLVVLALGIVVICVNIGIRWKTPRPQQIILEVTGTEGRAIEAQVDADGTVRKLTGTIPAQFTVEAHRLSWEVNRLDGPEKEKFRVAVHTPSEENWGGSAESDQIVRGGSIGPTGLRRKRAWLGRLEE